MRMVPSYATEAEFSADFLDSKEEAMVHTILTDMGHPQPTTPLQFDNICTDGIINGTMKKFRSKAIGMSFYWLNYRECQRKFHIH